MEVSIAAVWRTPDSGTVFDQKIIYKKDIRSGLLIDLKWPLNQPIARKIGQSAQIPVETQIMRKQIRLVKFQI